MKKALFTGLGFAALALATAGSLQASDAYCREYQRRVTIGGKVQDSYGTACMQPDGSWKIVNEDNPQVVGSVAPEPVYDAPEPVIVYEEEPVYVPYRTTYRTYEPAPVWWGVNLSFNERDHGWHGHRWENDRHHGGHHGRHHGRHDRH